MDSGRLRSVNWSDRTKELVSCCLALMGATATGMTAPSDNGEVAFTPKERAHWAFQKIAHPKPPKVERADWVRNSIDAFVLAELETKGLRPAPPADKITLIRRATFDLIGLPPTPEEVDAFLADDSAKAFDKVVDRLLASARYGERWARHWLDLARYAESEGFKADEIRPNAWRYRDYVITSVNNDTPYDRCINEQIPDDEYRPQVTHARGDTTNHNHNL